MKELIQNLTTVLFTTEYGDFLKNKNERLLILKIGNNAIQFTSFFEKLRILLLYYAYQTYVSFKL